MATVNCLNTYIVPTTANEVTSPSQPAFLAYLGTNDNNATGNGTVYTLGSGNALTEVFDQNDDFVTTGTFTAPVTGRYQFSVTLRADGFTAATTATLKLVTSNGTYTLSSTDGTTIKSPYAGSDDFIQGGMVLADMDAADTAIVTYVVSGEVGDIIIVYANNRVTSFSGFLAV